MLTSRITVPLPSEPESEDIFSSALSALFTDNTQNSHGTPGEKTIYCSPRYGEIVLHIPSHPDVDERRKLFAHYLWNSAVVAAEAFEHASSNAKRESERVESEFEVQLGWDPKYWNMRGKTVLELGAGTALPSIISALTGAKSVTITDHPNSPALAMGVIARNVQSNLFKPPNTSSDSVPVLRTDSVISIHGYLWGTMTLTTTQTNSLPHPISLSPPPSRFNRIVLADCLWMPSQHLNLTHTILTYLDTSCSNDDDTESNACALVIAGFHTGREIVRSFFETATGDYALPSSVHDEEDENKDPTLGTSQKSRPERGTGWELDSPHRLELSERMQEKVQGELKATEIFEIDVDLNRRAWQPFRKGETKFEAKRWCVCAVLMRR